MGYKRNLRLKYYINCDELSIYNYDKITKSGNLQWLVQGYEGRENIKIDVHKCEKLWSEIREEFFCKIATEKEFKSIWLTEEVQYLVNRYRIVSVLLDGLTRNIVSEENRPEYLKHLNRWRFYISDKKSLEPQYQKLTKQLDASLITISKKQEELKAINESAKTNEEINIYDQKLKLARLLNIQIDLKNTCCTEYAALLKQARKEVFNARKRNQGSQ